MDYIPLEKPIAELEIQIEELRRIAATQAIDLKPDIAKLENKLLLLRTEMFEHLSPYESVQIARHPRRPCGLDIIERICDDFIELHGDRNFYDDTAIVCGIGTIAGQSVAVLSHQKGRDTKENIKRNFGMAKPEGYRKALRIMSLAERFSMPIVTLVDTPGAYPGIGAEQRGQSEAIGKNIMVMNRLKVPIISIVTGEGGSGGALGLAVGNLVYMLQYSTYSVITPEGCASILMKDASKAPQMANALQLTADSALKLGVIDGIIPEPLGGAHRDPIATATNIKEYVVKGIGSLKTMSPKDLRLHRTEKFLNIGNPKTSVRKSSEATPKNKMGNKTEKKGEETSNKNDKKAKKPKKASK